MVLIGFWSTDGADLADGVGLGAFCRLQAGRLRYPLGAFCRLQAGRLRYPLSAFGGFSCAAFWLIWLMELVLVRLDDRAHTRRWELGTGNSNGEKTG